MKRRGFTLVEVLVVIAILMLLFALLMPATQAVWQSVLSTRCKHNLKTIFQAQASWRSDTLASTFTTGAGWQGLLMPYVEERESVFICPSSPGPGRALTALVTSRFHFVIHIDPTAKDQSRYYTPASGYPLTIPLDENNIFAYKVFSSAEYVEWKVDDGEHKTGQSKYADDIHFRIYYSNGMPTHLQLYPGATSSRFKYIYEFYVDGVCLVPNWVPLALNQAEIKLPQGASSLCDYALSRGTYEVSSGSVARIDPKLILILDYPKPIADYNNALGDNDEWDKYFIDELRVSDWLRKYGKILEKDQTWRLYQSLRHFGKANVLFCDGRIDLLAPEDLEETNPRWWFSSLR